MSDDEKKPVEETTEEEKPKVDEAEKSADAIALKIAEKLAGLMKTKEVQVEKKKEMAPTPSLALDRTVKLFTKRNGKTIDMKQSEVDMVAKWAKAFLNGDKKTAMEWHRKLEPLNETTAADGGNLLIPSLIHNAIVDLVEDVAVFRSRATVIDMSGMSTNQLNIPTVSAKPVASWGAEQGQKATSSMQFGSVTLTPYKLAAIVPITTELVQDAAFQVVQLVVKALAEAVAKAEDAAFASGSGTGRPTGLNTYTFAGFDAGGSLTYDELNRLYWLLPQAYREKATWVMNSRTVAALAGMVDSQNRPIFLESALEPGVPMFKGRPVVEQNNLEASSIFFGDLSAYFIAHKGNLQIDIAEQATVAGVSLWERNLIAVRAEERIDGELTTTRAFVEMSNTGVS